MGKTSLAVRRLTTGGDACEGDRSDDGRLLSLDELSEMYSGLRDV